MCSRWHRRRRRSAVAVSHSRVCMCVSIYLLRWCFSFAAFFSAITWTSIHRCDIMCSWFVQSYSMQSLFVCSGRPKTLTVRSTATTTTISHVFVVVSLRSSGGSNGGLLSLLIFFFYLFFYFVLFLSVLHFHVYAIKSRFIHTNVFIDSHGCMHQTYAHLNGLRISLSPSPSMRVCSEMKYSSTCVWSRWVRGKYQRKAIKKHVKINNTRHCRRRSDQIGRFVSLHLTNRVNSSDRTSVCICVIWYK